MNNITFLFSIVAIFFSFYIYFRFLQERKRNRILQSFVAGIIRSISDYCSKTDIVSPDSVPEISHEFPIPYKNIIENIQYEFLKDFWAEPYVKWLKKDRLLFNDEKYSNDGFNFIYWDFFDDLLKNYHSENSSLENKQKNNNEKIKNQEVS